MGSVALKARRGVAGMCLCVVPTVWMRTPRGVVVNQHPLWASPFFSELCSVQTNTQNMLNLYCPTSRGCIVFVRRWRRHGFAFCVDALLLFFLSSASCKIFSSSTSESRTHTGPESWLELTEPSANRTCSTHGGFSVKSHDASTQNSSAFAGAVTSVEPSLMFRITAPWLVMMRDSSLEREGSWSWPITALPCRGKPCFTSIPCSFEDTCGHKKYVINT